MLLTLLFTNFLYADDQGELDYYQRAINRDPSDLQSHLNYQRLALEMGKREQLVQEYSTYMHDNPKNGLYLYLYGRLHEDADRARIYLYKAVRTDTTLFHAHVELGQSYYHDGHYQEAINRYRVALRLKESATTRNLLGLAHYHSGYPQQAIAEYQQAIAQKPDYTDAYLNLGLAFYFTDQFEKAIQTYQNALKHPQEDIHLLYHNLGMAYRKLEQYDKAREAYQKALKHNPDYAESHISRGNLDLEKGDFQKAILAYRKALGTESENADLHLRLGLAYFNQQNYPQAISAFKTALDRDSTKIFTYNYLGKAYHLNNQPDEAIEALEAYIAREKRDDQKGRVAQAKTLIYEIKRDRITNILR